METTKIFLIFLGLVSLSISSCKEVPKGPIYDEQATVSNVIPNKAVLIDQDYSDICFSAQLNDTIDARFTFDTGLDDKIIIDSAFAVKYGFFEGVNIQKRITMHQIFKQKPHGAYYSSNITNLAVEFGNFKKNLKFFYILDLKKTFGCETDILIGSAMLEDEIFEINYTNSYLYVYKKTDSIPFSKYSKLDLHKENRQCYGITVRHTFNDSCSINLNYMLDTGTPRSFTITNMGQNDLEKVKECTTEDQTIYVYDVVNRVREFYHSTIEIGNDMESQYFFELPVMTLSPNTSYNGIVGNKFFKLVDPVFDLKNKHIYLKKTESGLDLKANNLGIELVSYL